MFTPARYVIVDDNAEELQQLAGALQSMGAPCLALLYDEVEGLAPGHMRGVRLLFLDLHLTTGGQSTDVKQAASVVIQMLEAEIQPLSGPYLIILWTKHAEQKEDFDEYLLDNLDPQKAPLAVLALDKNEYLGENTGPKLVSDVAGVIAADPRLRALLHWEHEVLRAAGTTLSELGALVAVEDRRAPTFSQKLDEVLSVLAREALGSANAEADPFTAINSVLLPILSDRVAAQRAEPGSNQIWKAAVTHIKDAPDPELLSSSKLNALLHVASAHGEQMTALSWGAVSFLPETDLSDAVMEKRFNLKAAPMLSQTFCVKEKADRKRSRLCVMRIGASCDHAQGRVGPIPYILGAIIPANAERRLEGVPKAELSTPPLLLPGYDEPMILAFNSFLQVTLVPAEVQAWQPLFRLREQLLVQFTSHSATYMSRPAIVSFNPKASPV